MGRRRSIEDEIDRELETLESELTELVNRAEKIRDRIEVLRTAREKL